jgi:hypothetical protein
MMLEYKHQTILNPLQHRCAPIKMMKKSPLENSTSGTELITSKSDSDTDCEK